MLIFPINASAGASIKESSSTIIPIVIYSNENGKKLQLDTKKNKLTALHFWATWCQPCVKELPEVNAAQKKYSAAGFKVITLSLDGKNTDNVKKFYDENHIDGLDILFDPGMESFQQLKIRGLPTTVFLNQDGKEIARSEGPLNWQSSEVNKFIGEKLQPSNSEFGQ